MYVCRGRLLLRRTDDFEIPQSWFIKVLDSVVDSASRRSFTETTELRAVIQPHVRFFAFCAPFFSLTVPKTAYLTALPPS